MRTRLDTQIFNKRFDLVQAPLLGLFSLWLISCCIAFYDLGDLPLRDFDEGTVARVSFELSQKTGISRLLPTIWGEPYLNKAPGLHWLIASFINFTNLFLGSSKVPSEFVIRFCPALLSTFVVPIGGLIQWKLRPNEKATCLATSGILLSLLPIARHGRLAMLDGTLLTAISLFWLVLICIEKKSSNKLRLFFAGLISSFLLLLKAPLLIPVSISALIPMLLTHRKLGFSWLKWYSLGIMPGMAWHAWHSFSRGADALWLWWGDGIGRVVFQTSSGSGERFLVPLLETLEGGWPWLLLFPLGIYIAFQERNKISGQWYLSTMTVMSLSIIPLKTQYPWYIHPLWLPFSLICGPALISIVNNKNHKKVAYLLVKIAKYLLLIISSLITIIGILLFCQVIQGLEPYKYIALSTGSFWLISSLLLLSRKLEVRKIGSISLFVGNIVGLLILMGSNFWLWELNESWEVKPIAEMINDSNAIDVKMSGSYGRPSLNWYTSQFIKRSVQPSPNGWILINNDSMVKEIINSGNCKVKDKREDWKLIYCE